MAAEAGEPSAEDWGVLCDSQPSLSWASLHLGPHTLRMTTGSSQVGQRQQWAMFLSAKTAGRREEAEGRGGCGRQDGRCYPAWRLSGQVL